MARAATILRKTISLPVLTIFMLFMMCLLYVYPPVSVANDDVDKKNDVFSEIRTSGTDPADEAKKEKTPDGYANVTDEIEPSGVTSNEEKQKDVYGDVASDEIDIVEGPTISDPIESFNRGMYHFNDKVYFWVWKPLSHGYKYVVPEGIRGIFSSFYENIKAPIRIINNLLQGEPKYAAIELAKFFINSTLGVGGLRDCAKECFGINGRYADFGQTLGKYGVGFGFYLVLPFLGPSSPRDGIGWLADWTLRPTSYVSTDEWFSPQSVGLYVHEKVNDTSFHLGEYEMLKEAAIDPYIAMRDAYVQYRTKLIER